MPGDRGGHGRFVRRLRRAAFSSAATSRAVGRLAFTSAATSCAVGPLGTAAATSAATSCAAGALGTAAATSAATSRACRPPGAAAATSTATSCAVGIAAHRSSDLRRGGKRGLHPLRHLGGGRHRGLHRFRHLTRGRKRRLHRVRQLARVSTLAATLAAIGSGFTATSGSSGGFRFRSDPRLHVGQVAVQAGMAPGAGVKARSLSRLSREGLPPPCDP